MKALLLSVGALLLSGCTQLGLTLANFPAKFSDIDTTRDWAFGPEPRQRLDIYRPPEARDAPVLVFFYGGRWTEGAKSMYPFVGEAFARQGYVTVIADHRQYPQVRFPVFVEDAARALAWVHDHIDRFGGSPDRIHVAGHSSGAHIGALVLADARYLAAYGKQPGMVRAFAGLAGPYDFEPEEADLQAMFGPPERYPLMQATTFIDGDEPPMLLLWGEADRLVGARNHTRLAQAVTARGGQVHTRTYANLDHVGIVASLTWFLRERRPVMRDVLSFFAQHGG
ncbi:alpha/beta hydrolase [Marinobacterium weihaiense]|uniref:Alpha/beta hydrolase n=1 Tax=Marinobacterium weihaiense TaxID=2851016 RepID=A0ABS6MG76_9GAMM|nr:alpha/beta hydrolase [Marinobacterium weihaiense]MBV0934712.1 alpha/beta hydrolase [Marinobacterium weihaiense]